MSQESGTESDQQEAAGRPTQRAAQKRTTTQRAAQSGQQEAAEGPTQETHRQGEPLRFIGLAPPRAQPLQLPDIAIEIDIGTNPAPSPRASLGRRTVCGRTEQLSAAGFETLRN